MNHSSPWLALLIGNSRYHWAAYQGHHRLASWNSEPFTQQQFQEVASPKFWRSFLKDSPIPELLTPSCPDLPLIQLASVVPEATERWHFYPHQRLITLDQVPLPGCYPTLGIDRALAVWGAGTIAGWPVLVIDAGTALTFTATDAQGQLIGGAILPGLRTQFLSLSDKTAALPAVTLPQTLPDRWALNTHEAIQSGILYSVLAGIREFIADWQTQFPNGKVFLTGGDAQQIQVYFQTCFPVQAHFLMVNLDLAFQGIAALQA